MDGFREMSSGSVIRTGLLISVPHKAVQSKAMRDSCFPQSTVTTINTVHTAFVYFMVFKNTFMVL